MTQSLDPLVFPFSFDVGGDGTECGVLGRLLETLLTECHVVRLRRSSTAVSGEVMVTRVGLTRSNPLLDE